MTYLPNKEIKRSKNILRALYHPLRQHILATIWNIGNSINVTELYVALRIEQTVASMHLAILHDAKLVTKKRDGKNIYYSVDYPEIERLDSLIKQINNSKN